MKTAVFAITAAVILFSTTAKAYDCPTNGCYGYSPSEAQNAYNQQQYQNQIIRQNEQILQQQRDMQNQIDSLQQGY